MNSAAIKPNPAWKTRAKTILARLEIEDNDAFHRSNILRQTIESMSLSVVAANQRMASLTTAERQPDTAFGYNSEVARQQIAVEKANLTAEIQALNEEVDELKQRANDMATRTAITAGVYSRAKKVFNQINGNVSTASMGVI